MKRTKWLHPSLLAGGVLFGAFCLIALVSLVWTPHETGRQDLNNRFAPMGSPGNLLGTDHLGRDVLSQIMGGAYTSLTIGLAGALLGMVLGVTLGGLAAMSGRAPEQAIMRFADILYAFPGVIIAILLVAKLGAGVVPALVAIGISFTPTVTRVTRSAALSVLEREFVPAAYAYGRRRIFVYLRHVLPNIGHVLIVQGTILFAVAIIVEAGLSYLGLGPQPPIASLGRMLRDAQSHMIAAPQLAVLPGLMIMASVLGLNLLGDGLRDVLDPRLHTTTGGTRVVVN